MAHCYGDKDRVAALKALFDPDTAAAGAAAGPLPRISAGLFRQLVEERGAGPVRPCRVVGKADFSDARFSRGLRLHGIRFDADMTADVARFASLDFHDCEFRGRLDLRSCHFKGSLSLVRCRFLARGKASPKPRLVLGGSRIAGSLALDMVALEGSCSLSGVVVGGDLKAGGIAIDARAGDGALLLDNARVAGRILLAPWGRSARGPRGARAAGRRSTLPGGLSAFGATCHSFMIKAVDVGGECCLSGVQVTTSFESTDNAFAGDVRFDHLDCGEVVTVRGCSVGGSLSIACATIPAQLNLADGRFGRIHLNGARIGSFWVGTLGEVSCTRLHATSTSFASYVKLSRLQVRIEEGGGAAADEASSAARHETGVIEFEHCRFDSLVTTWPILGVVGIDGWRKNDRVRVERAFLFTDCEVGGQLNLTRLKVGGAEEPGVVRLDRTRLRGPLLISSPLAIAKRRQVPRQVRDKAWAIVRAGKAMSYRARMCSLSMREFRASAVELSGLDLVHRDGGGVDVDDNGCLVGDRMEIAGRFETYVTAPDPKSRAQTAVGGAIRLRAARIGELHLDGDSFRQRHNCVAWKSGVVLELAEIGLLRVPRVDRRHGADHNGFPVPLDLSGMTVRNWNFGEDVDTDVHAGCDEYLDFLDNDETLHREVYKSVAVSLRDAGRDRDAEKILFAEEYRARWETRQARSRRADKPNWPERSRRGRPKGRRAGRLKQLRRAFAWLGHLLDLGDRYLLQYRRNPIMLLYLILLLYTGSVVFVSSHAGNFELSEAARLVLQNEDGEPTRLASGIESKIDGQNVGPAPDHWTGWNAVWMAARYHVPIVSVAIEDEFVPSNDNRLRFGFPWNPPDARPPGPGPRTIPFSAEDWFALMAMLNWVMWPLLLTFALRRALRSD
jgi:hypothetical protein